MGGHFRHHFQKRSRGGKREEEVQARPVRALLHKVCNPSLSCIESRGLKIVFCVLQLLDVLHLTFSAANPKMIRVSVRSFLDMLLVSIRTLLEFDTSVAPPPTTETTNIAFD